LGNSDTLLAGQDIIVTGSPLGLEGTVTKGIISNPKRLIDDQTSIQLDAAVSPGNSGAPVLNNKAEVVGIIYAGFLDVAVQNINLAIPINEIKPHLGVNLNLSLAEATGAHETQDMHEETVVEHLILDDGSVYSGEMKDGYPHGWGFLTTLEGDIALGEWRNGLLHGIGLVIINQGDEFRIGIWQEGEPVGTEGWFVKEEDGTLSLVDRESEVLVWDDGITYVREATDETPCGWGGMAWPNGDLYLGEWQDGFRHGIGIYIWDDGDIFIGKWENGDWTEHGAWFDADGTLW
jgi:hypothetical protein